mmetsp:Transcript_61430/g.105722  ORF Transcript_61430/g.105722 Transcript_61430/m.105722 type:complete len:210 (+) Transcript_61430:93-722(+)
MLFSHRHFFFGTYRICVRKEKMLSRVQNADVLSHKHTRVASFHGRSIPSAAALRATIAKETTEARRFSKKRYRTLIASVFQSQLSDAVFDLLGNMSTKCMVTETVPRLTTESNAVEGGGGQARSSSSTNISRVGDQTPTLVFAGGYGAVLRDYLKERRRRIEVARLGPGLGDGGTRGGTNMEPAVPTDLPGMHTFLISPSTRVGQCPGY